MQYRNSPFDFTVKLVAFGGLCVGNALYPLFPPVVVPGLVNTAVVYDQLSRMKNAIPTQAGAVPGDVSFIQRKVDGGLTL